MSHIVFAICLIDLVFSISRSALFFYWHEGYKNFTYYIYSFYSLYFPYFFIVEFLLSRGSWFKYLSMTKQQIATAVCVKIKIFIAWYYGYLLLLVWVIYIYMILIGTLILLIILCIEELMVVDEKKSLENNHRYIQGQFTNQI